MIGLIVEGGGTRALFSAGVLDYFIKRELEIPYIIGVSAGAGIGASFASKQFGRNKASLIDYLNKGRYVGFKVFREKGSFFDLDLIYDTFPNELYPFDYDTYFKTRFIVTATNMLTGQAAYLEEYNDKNRLMSCFKASSSIPVVSPPIYLDDIPMLDGGIADSIPIKKAFADGCSKVIVILSRNEDYVKKDDRLYNMAAKIKYYKYPKFYQAIKNRPKVYNQALEEIKELEKQGKVFALRPITKEISRSESDVAVLTDWYQSGYDEAKRKYDEVLEFINK